MSKETDREIAERVLSDAYRDLAGLATMILDNRSLATRLLARVEAQEVTAPASFTDDAVKAMEVDTYLSEQEKHDGHIQTIWLRAAEWGVKYAPSPVEAAVAAEREACALIAEDFAKWGKKANDVLDFTDAARDIAESIRARSNGDGGEK